LDRHADVCEFFADTGRGFTDLDLRGRGRVLGLDDLFLTAKGFNLGLQPLLGIGELLLLLLQTGDLLGQATQLSVDELQPSGKSFHVAFYRPRPSIPR